MAKKSTLSPQKAFERAAAGYEFGGKVLHKFSAMRQAAASKMGLRFGLVDEKDLFSVTVETLKNKKKVKTDLQFYNQLFSDVVTVIWLCTVLDSRVLRALRKVDEATEEAFKWAGDNGLTIISDHYFQAAALFFRIMQDTAVSTAIPKPAGGDPDDDEDGAPNE